VTLRTGALRVSRSPLQLPLVGLFVVGVVQLLPLWGSGALSLDPNATRVALAQIAGSDDTRTRAAPALSPDEGVSMSAQSNEDLVRTLLEEFSRGDLAAVSAHFAPDAVWDLTGEGILAGQYQGPEAIVGLDDQVGTGGMHD